MAYILTTDIETFLNITLTVNGQATVNALIPAVEAFADSYCNRTWAVTGNQVETFDGGGTVFLIKHPPINAVLSITEDGTVVGADSYYAYKSYIKSLSPLGTTPRSVVITYTSSITPPADLKHALVRWVAEIFKTSEDAGKTTRRVKMGSVDIEYLIQDGIPTYVEMVLKRYRLNSI